jgi:hypothetical protein
MDHEDITQLEMNQHKAIDTLKWEIIKLTSLIKWAF